MQVVYAHYHLNRGGVTQVIVNQIRAVAQLPGHQRPHRVGVLYGGRADGWPQRLWAGEAPIEVDLIAVPEVDYDNGEMADPHSLAERVAKALQSREFPPESTILHVHNHGLGKNISWPAALGHLAELRYRLLLQIHDFAEDFRPDNYRRLMHAYRLESPAELARVLYPVGPAIHYVALTQRDARLLQGTGLADDQLHLLANPIGDSVDLPTGEDVATKVRQQIGIAEDARLVIYPVRGIRRKNLGELLLLAALSDEDVWFGVTLAPQNPTELGPFDRWRGLASELDLRCLFDTCGAGGVDFTQAVAAADALITTSVAEGFGMVFLEGWLAGKPLVGRDLPEITSDVVTAGLCLKGLYRKLAIPVDWVGGQIELSDVIYQAYQWACHDYGVPVAEREEVVAQLDRLMDGGTIDFAHLPTLLQQRVIRRAVQDESARQEICQLNPELETLLTGRFAMTPDVIASNADVVRQKYAMPQMADRLGTIYRRLLAQPAGKLDGPLPTGDRILTNLLRLSRLHPLRLET
jgi:hypothetical protein